MKNPKLLWLLISAASLLTVLSLSGEIYYPWKNTFIGALDPRAWPGLVVVTSPSSGFAFAPRVYRQDKLAEFHDFFYLVSEVGPHSPDGLYASMKFDLRLPFKKGRETPIFLKPTLDDYVMLVEWSRRDEQTVVGRYRFPAILDRVVLVFYFPWDFKGSYYYLPASSYIHGQSAARKNEQFLCWLSLTPEKVEPVGSELHVTFKVKDETELHFAVGSGESLETISDRIYRFRSGGAINDILKEERLAYNKKRLQVTGLYQGAAEAITNNLFWMTLYQNGHHRFYTPAGRGWIFPRPDGQADHWTIFEWDSFFNSLEIAVESQKLASDVVKAVLQTQYPNGNIPNWRGRFNGTPDRSQPPVGSFAVLKLFLRTGDRELIQFAYPYLKKWHQFWTEPMPGGHPRRDGNNDGLLEWGSDAGLVAGEVPPWEKEASGKQRAMWESGEDDLPNWDEAGFNDRTGTMEMNCVDLNSLYALDSYCLARLAEFLGKDEDRKKFLDEYEKTKKLMNLHLWNEKEGFYFDRHWDGRFSSRKAASNFFPLVARIPDEKQALKMLRHLLNPEEFWGDFVLPTISRDDPAFSDQQYWRGTIWPPTNYLVYQGLKSYGLDLVAADFARKSTDLFLRIWKNYQLCPENFDSRTGEAGGQRYQSWGPLFALIGVEEYLDITPWDGFRFGQLKPETKGLLKRMSILGRHYEVELSPSRVKLIEEGRELLRTDSPAVFRHFLYTPREISFEVKSLKKNTISLNLGTRKKGQILINGKEAGQFEGRQVEVRVPEGEQAVVVIIQD
ncbi:MAG: alpha-glucosidase [Candidatus Saccharicenans subterraneus]|uniref:Alpha-glucosidase n=1 Tax=Candidatus Saccharicenans subterraneus TaxID=2508984 RepID=A0A3E2BN65_9BACT|nr:MAG: alpha-glucosidase [Candidatus Saccharicenans subterraneum]